MITVAEIKKDQEVLDLLKYTQEQLGALGYTEHSSRHVGIVSKWAGEIIAFAGGTEQEIRLTEIAGYLHDIGNAINRRDHAQSGALLAYQLLKERGMPTAECAQIMMAIGNHDELDGEPVSNIAAALIIADKSDVHRSRLRLSKRNQETADKNIHDRVNYAATNSHIKLIEDQIILNITIDTTITPIIDYFEIYFNRMKLCRSAGKKLGKEFSLVINGVKFV
ncbi:MAG: HD domain-containing protein [Bacillota bacterium]